MKDEVDFPGIPYDKLSDLQDFEYRVEVSPVQKAMILKYIPKHKSDVLLENWLIVGDILLVKDYDTLTNITCYVWEDVDSYEDKRTTKRTTKSVIKRFMNKVEGDVEEFEVKDTEFEDEALKGISQTDVLHALANQQPEKFSGLFADLMEHFEQENLQKQVEEKKKTDALCGCDVPMKEEFEGMLWCQGCQKRFWVGA